jgi:hypothetical protein
MEKKEGKRNGKKVKNHLNNNKTKKQNEGSPLKVLG